MLRNDDTNSNKDKRSKDSVLSINQIINQKEYSSHSTSLPPPPTSSNVKSNTALDSKLVNTSNIENISKPLANADDLLSVFQQRLNSTLQLDTIANNYVNDLKLMNDEFQFLSTTNGINLDPKFTDNLKYDINLFNSKNSIFDKIIKRQKQVDIEKPLLNNLKSQVLDFLVDVQTEREYILHSINHPRSKLKLAQMDDSYIAPLRVNDINPFENIALNNKLPSKSSKSVSKSLVDSTTRRRAGRKSKAEITAPNNTESKTISTTILAPKPTTKRGGKRKGAGRGGAKVGTNIRGGRSSKKNSLASTAIANNSIVGKRKRKPSSKAEETLEIHKNPDILIQPKRRRKKVGVDQINTDISNKESNEVSSITKSSLEFEDNYPSGDELSQIINGGTKPKLSNKELKSLERQYDNTYLSIWKDLARKDSPKAYRLFQQTAQAKSINLRKTAQLAARESRKWQIKTTKAQKDQLSKARRCMREMMSFWKKNEKEERNLRLKAEQEALQKAKKEEEDREAKRQARKLNFLINQTELYSHFIGRKIKTSEFEGDMGDKSISSSNNHNANEDEVDLSMATKDFHNLNFDEENEESLNKMAAANAQSALLEAKNKAQQFNNGVKRASNDDNGDDDDENEGEMNFQNPTSIGDITVEQPKLLNCTLKEYQRKGLNWLANLYEQGINGILADEMGLGKTVQSISVLAYLAETHDIWGPFLVVTPASTLHNWQQEITKFVPDFNVLPYWGTAKDRKVLRKFWDRKNIIYNRNSPFHVVVTSYQLVVADNAYFQKMKWQYMILDEAQAIKSSQSSRWKSLLSFQCRNRLLLTGTPIQNNMQELWALLHFIMPSLFDSHDEFSEWFSKDIEAHAQSNSKLNEEQLRRLHAILKPFMLRRIKKNVQSELGEKIEIDVYCDLTNRQKKLYRMLRSQINLVDLIENNKRIGNNEEVESLMNVVMQFRKVCNHPDLFERADSKSAFCFADYPMTESLLREVNETTLDVNYNTRNLIQYTIPKLILNDCLLPSYEKSNLSDKDRLIQRMFNIYQPKNYIHDDKTEMSILKFVNESPGDVERIVSNNLIMNAIYKRSYIQSTDEEKLKLFKEIYDKDKDSSLVFNHNSNINPKIPEFLKSITHDVSMDMYMKVFQKGYFQNALAPPIDVVCSKENFNVMKDDIFYNPVIRQALLPLDLNIQAELIEKDVDIKEWPKAEMLPEEESNYFTGGTIRLPSMERFVLESAKLKKLDQMLVDLKKGDHKCLIYFQMTRMMDLMEEYLSYRQYKYIRLDGSSKLSDRRDLVNDWQTNPELFIFLLSTRAGGLGINLTAADTVIFYDSDWNPTIDSQAMDRAHRLGQTRQVTVYRLLVRGTIEERMRDRAKQKEHVQQVVMEGKVDSINEKEEKEREKKEMALWLLEDDK
ncbi:putative DNA helicase ino80 [Pichia californica]|uniref:Chromatin-remodeling ATPase INO80 n=1 Tax=Pichia californica TaxID=460514 RepID=A0A9P6WGV1_9ASCO|nr:putative DNA helicase ino80 [[Candida] californica]